MYSHFNLYYARGSSHAQACSARWSGHLPTSSGRPGRVLMAAPFYEILTVLKFLGEMLSFKLPVRFCSKFAYGFPMKVQEQIPTGILPGNVKKLVKITIF